MNTLCLQLAVVFLAVAAMAQTAQPSEVEITAEPSHHLALQNKYVRVFQVEADPQKSTLVHRHRHDYIFVTLGDTEISNEEVGKAPVSVKLKDGEVRFAAGNFAHRVLNVSKTPFRNVTIEFLQDGKASAKQWDEDRALHVLHGGTEDVLFVKDGARVSEVELQVAGVLPKHKHSGPQLLVAVTDLELRDDVAGKPATNLEMKSGEIKWFDEGLVHTVTNVGRQGAKFVTVEF